MYVKGGGRARIKARTIKPLNEDLFKRAGGIKFKGWTKQAPWDLKMGNVLMSWYVSITSSFMMMDTGC